MGTRILLFLAYLRRGKLAEAQAALPKATSAPDPFLIMRAMVLAAAGDRPAARRLLAELEHDSSVPIHRVGQAIAYLAVGDKDGALRSLEAGVDEQSFSVHLIKVAPDLDPLRSEPRFQELLKRMNLE